MAVERVDVVAQPHAGVGELQPRRPGGLGQALGQRAASRGRVALLEPEEPGRPRSAAARRSSRRPARGRGCRPAGAARRRRRAPARPRRRTARRCRPPPGAAPRAAPARRRGSRSRSTSVERLQQRRAQLRAGAAGRSRSSLPRCRSETTRVVHAARLVCRAVPPLDGILVADFSRVLAGPLAAMLLGDLGADVVKVERPDGGDDTRAVGPAVARRRGHLLPRAQPQQALARARPGRRGRPRAGAARWASGRT